ncbi:MAG: hypothetical protein H0W74_11375 [Sphingosinicella sp.]|nr:hypothetical protein [Sphingosinicella sp.]
MTNALPRRFVLVSPPSVHSAIGEALRKAFERQVPARFLERLLAKLDRY